MCAGDEWSCFVAGWRHGCQRTASSAGQVVHVCRRHGIWRQQVQLVDDVIKRRRSWSVAWGYCCRGNQFDGDRRSIILPLSFQFEGIYCQRDIARWKCLNVSPPGGADVLCLVLEDLAWAAFFSAFKCRAADCFVAICKVRQHLGFKFTVCWSIIDDTFYLIAQTTVVVCID